MGRIGAVFKADGAETQDRYSISEWWLEPHTQGPGPHSHPEDDVFYVIEGTMSVLVGEHWTQAAKGSFVLVPGGTVHDFENRYRPARRRAECFGAGRVREGDAGHLGMVRRAPAEARSTLTLERGACRCGLGSQRLAAASIAASTGRRSSVGPIGRHVDLRHTASASRDPDGLWKETGHELSFPCRLARAVAGPGPAAVRCGSGGQHADAERLLDDRPGQYRDQVPARGVRRLDLLRLQRLDHQRGEICGADGRRRVPLGAVERRHRERAPRQVGRGRLRHLQQQDRRRAVVHAGELHARGHLRDVRQRRPAGALELQEPDGHVQLLRAWTRR